jgi:3',5'-cyclic AMP phosphodiesterase CpdA
VKHLGIIILLWAEIVCSVSAFAQNGTGSFRFALITDTHLKQTDPRNEATLRQTVKDLNAQNNLDFVIVSGDVADKGDRPSLLKAKQLLDSLKMPYYAIPGNHDTRYCKTTTSTFDSVFVQHHFSFTHKGFFFIGFNTGQGNSNNKGHVNQKEFNWIDKQLSKIPPKQPVVAITHFPIVTIQVDDSAQIVNHLLKYNIKAILGGHYHRNAAFDYKGVPGILTRTLQPSLAGKSGYSIFEFSNQIKAYERNPFTSSATLWLTLPIDKEAKATTESNP